MTVLMGIDIGTTATKAVLLDTASGVVSRGSRPTVLYSRNGGWAEQDTAQWWINVCELAKELCANHKIDGIAVSGMVPCTVLVDEFGEPLRMSIQQNDARAIHEIEDLKSRLAGARVLERTGSAVTQQSVGPKLMWLARHEEGILERTATILGSYDYITFRLTGSKLVERNWALESGLYDFEADAWGEDLVEAVGIRPELLPGISRPGEPAGAINRQGALETGLAEGLPVYVGSADHVAAAFAAGSIRTGDVVVKLGGQGTSFSLRTSQS